jgi:hypothetical protein
VTFPLQLNGGCRCLTRETPVFPRTQAPSWQFQGAEENRTVNVKVGEGFNAIGLLETIDFRPCRAGVKIGLRLDGIIL